MFANLRPHRIPVLDPADHVVGMITQVDLISGLYWHGVVKAGCIVATSSYAWRYMHIYQHVMYYICLH
jgi:hypothetical protein